MAQKMTETQFRQELKTGLSGVYFFYGGEEYLKQFYIGRAQKLTLGDDGNPDGAPDFADLNFHNISQKPGDTGLSELEDAVLSPPFMGGKTFIKYTFSPSSLTAAETEQLKDLCLGLCPDDTLLVLCAKDGGFDAGRPEKNKPSAAYKAYAAFSKVVDIAAQTPSDLKKWMARRLATQKLRINTDAADLLLSRSGHNMYALSGELEKLSAYALANQKSVVDSETVALVSSVNDEDDGFALANALLDGDRRRALHVFMGCKQRREEAARIMASVIRCFCDMLAVAALLEEGADTSAVADRLKMHPYRAGLYASAVRERGARRIAAALERCRDADIKLKTTRLDYIAIERFICTIPVGRSTRRIHR